MHISPAPLPRTGTAVVSQHNANMWWFTLGAANVGSVVLLLLLVSRPIGNTVIPGLVVGLLIWVTANAVLVPIALIQTRRRLILDFDHGSLATRGVTYPAVDFEALLRRSRSFPGSANLLTLAYRSGSVDVQVDGFTPTLHTRTRDEALRAFIWQCLPAPTTWDELLSSDLMVRKHRIGKTQALALLGSGLTDDVAAGHA